MTKSKKNKSIKNKSRKNHTRKHKGKCTNKNCKLCNMSGGNCGACNNPLNLLQQQQGGSFYKPAGPIPGPFVGQPWGAPIEKWPGVNGVGADRNYNAFNNYIVDPQTAMKLEGGRRKKRKSVKKRRKGGGLIPQNLVNLGRMFTYNMGSSYNALNGYPAPVNPLPYKDQFPNSKNFTI